MCVCVCVVVVVVVIVFPPCSCSDKSEMVLVQSDGKILAWSEGGPTNQLVNIMFVSVYWPSCLAQAFLDDVVFWGFVFLYIF